MKEIFLSFLNNVWILLNSIAFFVLLAVLVAGIIKLLLPEDFIKKHMGRHDFLLNIKAALLGIPLAPDSGNLFSFITALKKNGTSRCALQIFLVSRPIIGVDSLIVTYGVFGWLLALYRFVTSVIIALLAGFLSFFLNKEETPEFYERTAGKGSFSTVSGSHKVIPIEVVPGHGRVKYRLLAIGQSILSYSFDDIFKNMARGLLIGLLVAALMMTLTPGDLSHYIANKQALNYILVLAVSMPLSLCATASIPLALSLLSVGFSPGAAFIFLTVGPATSILTINRVLKLMGKKSLIIYLLSVVIGSVFFGFFFDFFFSAFFDSAFSGSLGRMLAFDEHENDIAFMTQISSVLLLYLSLKYTLNKNSTLIKKGGCSGGSCCGS